MILSVKTSKPISPFLQALGREIAAARNLGRWSQEELAKKAGMNRAHLSEAERGLANLCVETLRYLCIALDVNLADLIQRALDNSQSGLG